MYFKELVEFLDANRVFHAVKRLSVLRFEYLLIEHFLFCLYSGGGDGE